MVAITIDRLAVAYGRSKVIENLSLSIDSGSFFTLLGPSGCGKTTLLRALAGFLPATEGKLLFGEQDITNVPAHKRDIGMVFQDYALFPDKTVFDNVAYGLRARGMAEGEIKTRVGEYLERVGLSGFPSRRPAELSGGQRQRVALARALVIQPQLLLMDEPLSNLDAKLRLQVRETIAELQREAGITTVFVTHDQEEALALSNRIGLMKEGKLEQVGAPGEIYETPVSTYVANFVGGANTIPIEIDSPVKSGPDRRVKLAGHTIAVRSTADLPAGQVMLVIRPEDIAFVKSQKDTIPATITAKQYLGSSTHYGLRLSDGTKLAANLHGPGHNDHAVGAVILIQSDSRKSLLVAS